MRINIFFKVLITFFILSFIMACDPEVIPDDQPDSGIGYVFDIKALPVIYMDISTEEWNKLLSYFDINEKNEEYIHGDFIFVKGTNRDTLPDIGLRLRGNTSRRRPEGVTGEVHNPTNPDWHHVHFAVNFKKYNKTQKLRGLEKINLKWFKDDGMYVREVYCYDLFERFGVWTSPQSSYCKLYLRIKEDNELVYYGVYQMVEPVDKEYLKNRPDLYSDSDGNLWKANWGADLRVADKSKMGIENITLTETYEPAYDLKTNDDDLETAKTQLAQFITDFNTKQGTEFQSWIESRMDIPLFLKTYAVNVLCGMWDDYWNNSNNFYFYFDSQNKFYFIPYDYDNTLGTSLLMDDAGRQDLLNWGKTSNPLVKKIITIPAYKTMYVAYLKELYSPDKDLFYHTRSISRITAWQAMVQPFLNNDTEEDTELVDVPASWGNCPHYRLLSPTNNYFKTRALNLPN